MRVTLTVIAGPHEGRVFTFAGHDTFLVGRSKTTHFPQPRDRWFSRSHFLIEVNPPHCRLLDMDSHNGTFVNGQKVTTVDLHHGDVIKAGKTVLRVCVEEDSEAVVPPAALPTTAPAAPLPALPTGKPAVATPSPVTSPVALAPAVGADDQATCRVCGDLLSGGLPAPLLCFGCEEQARQLPQRLPGHRLIRELGRGGMGIVYLALRLQDGAAVALKTIAPAATVSHVQVERFLREAAILRELQHSHIVRFQEMGEADGLLYFTMEYVPGTDAKRLLKLQGACPVERAVALGCQLLEALEYAHGQQFVHRDIKPSNLLVAEEDGREVVRLSDFGLARVYQSSALSGLTLAGDVGGTVAFMAPEQITNFREALPAVDQYATAATLYNLLTAQKVYDLPAVYQQQLKMILQEEPVPIHTRRADVPKDLAAVIHKALAREPKERFADVRAMRRALLELGY